MKNQTIIIIGSGVSGLACAAKLQQAGLKPTVYDKGRNIGGRLATRRTRNGLQFDHGAQYMTAKTPEFREVLHEAQKNGKVGEWDLGHRVRYVGVPGMSGFAEFISKGVDVKQDVEASSVKETADGYNIQMGDQVVFAHKLVITTPAPQTMELLGDQHPLTSELVDVELEPCLTLMVNFDLQAPIDCVARQDSDDPISWIAMDSSKPKRTTQHCWVAHASPSWSAEFIEEEKSAIAERMLPLVCERLGLSTSNVVYAVAHRWRYAAVSKPLGRPFAKSSNGALYLGGDWCLDARVEAAWTSGNAIATEILRET
ncbi:MAG: FAD-dependent oxidoreductase [Pseudomonadota bacterium]